MIAVINYDMGNLLSVTKALTKVGAEVRVTRDAQVISDASHVVLPGVGAFSSCMDNLTRYELIEPIKKSVASGKPFLGICLGLQLLFEESEEKPLGGTNPKGLGILKGQVKKFSTEMTVDNEELKVPHMGWNSIKIQKDSGLLKDVPDGSYFYFVHSYFCAPEDDSIALTKTDYGVEFVSSIKKDNIFACQFHPEKSQQIGLKVLKDFSELK